MLFSQSCPWFFQLEIMSVSQHHLRPCSIVPAPTAVCTPRGPLQLNFVYIFQFRGEPASAPMRMSGKICFLTWFPCPISCFHFWASIGSDPAVDQEKCRLRNAEDEKLAATLSQLDDVLPKSDMSSGNPLENTHSHLEPLHLPSCLFIGMYPLKQAEYKHT